MHSSYSRRTSQLSVSIRLRTYNIAKPHKEMVGNLIYIIAAKFCLVNLNFMKIESKQEKSYK